MEAGQVFKVIVEEHEKSGFYPSYTEIADILMCSKSTVNRKMLELEANGIIKFNHNRTFYKLDTV